jgi:hypothetical protein
MNRDAALLAHAGGVLYGTELGSVTLKRELVYFVFQLNTQHTVLKFACPHVL